MRLPFLEEKTFLKPAVSRDPSHIFLSGSTADFEQVRLDLDKALRRSRCHVVQQESFPQTVSDTLLKLAQLIEPCGMMIHMIGQNPGSIPTPEIRAQYLDLTEKDGKFLAHRPDLRAALGDFSTITYTQWEAYIAIHRGIPLLVYVDANHDSPTHPQRAHLDRLQGMARYASSFEDHSSLHRMVMADLMAHFALHPSTREIPLILKPSNLPGSYIGRLFLGRDEFLKTLRQSLLGHGHATAVTQKSAATVISGLGGIGKTHAAVEYAHRHREDYTALLFASADSPEKLHSSLATLCEVLHLDESGNLPPDERVRVRATFDWLASHPGWLLILDNVDDEPAAKAVQEILGQLTSGHVLITSRLHGWSDQVKNIDLEVLSETSAAELLLELTAILRRLAPDDETQARQLAILLEGLPLAIHQAAGYINEQALTLAAYHVLFQDETAHLLAWFDDLRIPYKRPEILAPKPVLVTWKNSFDKLSETDCLWLLVFSHFSPDPIPAFLLEPTENATLEQKSMLRDARNAIAHAEKYCLLTRSRTEFTFKIHRLVQEITRLLVHHEDQSHVIQLGMNLFCVADLGKSQDVRNWPKWNQLQSHCESLCSYALDESPPEFLSWLLSELGILLSTKALHAEAEPYYHRALMIDRAAFGGDHPDVARRLSNLASLLLDTNRLIEAEPLMREALRIDRAARGDNDAIVATRLNNLAQLLKASNRLTEAEPLMRQALCIDRTILGDDHPDVARDLNNLGRLLHETNRLCEAEPMYMEALRIVRATSGYDHPDYSRVLNNLAQLLLATNRLIEAEPLMREALRIDCIAYGNDHPTVATRLNNLAILLWTTNRLSGAEPLMREALRILHDCFGPGHPKTVGISRNLDSLISKKENRLPEKQDEG